MASMLLGEKPHIVEDLGVLKEEALRHIAKKMEGKGSATTASGREAQPLNYIGRNIPRRVQTTPRSSGWPE